MGKRKNNPTPDKKESQLNYCAA
jgi:hypothetical protein